MTTRIRVAAVLLAAMFPLGSAGAMTNAMTRVAMPSQNA